MAILLNKGESSNDQRMVKCTTNRASKVNRPTVTMAF